MSSDPYPVVVAFGAIDDLRRCLETLGPPCVVVDNSSSNEISELVHGFAMTYIDPGENLGFAAAVNMGTRATPLDVDVAVINPDAIVTRDDLASLHESLRSEERCAAVAPRLVSPGGAPQRTSWPFPSPGRMWHQAMLGGDGPSGPQFLVGAVLVIRRDALLEVGGFDERFFLYAEETDWQRRALDAGWALVENSHVIATHVGSGTSSDEEHRMALFHAGTELYIRKWFGPLGWLSYRAAAVLAGLVRALAQPHRRRENLRRARLFLEGPVRSAGMRP